MKDSYIPNSKLVAGIDIAAEGSYCWTNIIKPKDINELPEDGVIIVVALSARESAKKSGVL